ncbi:hypothetical protein [Xanthomonas campestris]|uniref:hypothetical protein n=1 Tax=Xanthomonas campestris TaxID=339 RepID=UPI001F119AA1|nr:hypothetical protein [Xanthomonas campestris]MEB1628684.1 hypothetical protein [Xanthomonas campestris pv. campestris]
MQDIAQQPRRMQQIGSHVGIGGGRAHVLARIELHSVMRRQHACLDAKGVEKPCAGYRGGDDLDRGALRLQRMRQQLCAHQVAACVGGGQVQQARALHRHR